MSSVIEAQATGIREVTQALIQITERAEKMVEMGRIGKGGSELNH
ncbi:hypothetical protein [Dehalobacter sp.]|nr:hypothetical protein [Dehalobacter sp.]MDJ0306639.1 hypothetical protein [Dehalobacter sp.]